MWNYLDLVLLKYYLSLCNPCLIYIYVFWIKSNFKINFRFVLTPVLPFLKGLTQFGNFGAKLLKGKKEGKGWNVTRIAKVGEAISSNESLTTQLNITNIFCISIKKSKCPVTNIQLYYSKCKITDPKAGYKLN